MGGIKNEMNLTAAELMQEHVKSMEVIHAQAAVIQRIENVCNECDGAPWPLFVYTKKILKIIKEGKQS
jgi:hypothetical protein